MTRTHSSLRGLEASHSADPTRECHSWHALISGSACRRADFGTTHQVSTQAGTEVQLRPTLSKQGHAGGATFLSCGCV